MTSKQLKGIRTVIMICGIAAAFLIWLGLPAWVKNNALVHVGNGRFGAKAGCLLVLLLPLIALIPHRPDSEIHTADERERAEMTEEREKRSAKLQIVWAILMSGVACLCLLLFEVYGVS